MADDDKRELKKETVAFRVTNQTLEEVEQYQESTGLSQSDAMRELLRRGLDAAKFMEILDELDEQRELLKAIIDGLGEIHPHFAQQINDRYL